MAASAVGSELLLVSSFASALSDVVCSSAPEWGKVAGIEPLRPSLCLLELSGEVAVEAAAAAAAGAGAGASDACACAVVSPGALRACRLFAGAWVTLTSSDGAAGERVLLAWVHASPRVPDGAVMVPPHAVFHLCGWRAPGLLRRPAPSVRVSPLPCGGAALRSFARAPRVAVSAVLARVGRPSDEEDVTEGALDAALRQHLAVARALTVGAVFPVLVRGGSVLNEGAGGVATAFNAPPPAAPAVAAAGVGGVVSALNSALRRDRVVCCVCTSLCGGGSGGGELALPWAVLDSGASRVVVREAGARAPAPSDTTHVVAIARVLCGTRGGFDMSSDAAALPAAARAVDAAPAADPEALPAHSARVAGELARIWAPLVAPAATAAHCGALRFALGLFGARGSGKRAAVAAAAAALGMHVAERSFHDLAGLTSRALSKNLAAFVTTTLERHTPCVIVVRNVADKIRPRRGLAGSAAACLSVFLSAHWPSASVRVCFCHRLFFMCEFGCS
jgi:hypothetical protein